MEVARSSPSYEEGVSSKAKQLDQSGSETPCSLTVSETTKQSRLLFPRTPSSGATPTETQQPMINNLHSSSTSGTMPLVQQQTATLLAAILTQPDNVSGDTVKSHVTSSTSASSTAVPISPTMRKVLKTKKEREALRLERERLKAEAQALKEEEKLKKEEAKLKREQEKKARRERREQEEKAKQEKKEAKEKEKREKLEKKEMERQRKEDDDRRRKEERKKAELEKQQSEEEKVRKQHKAQELFNSFFNRLPKTEANQIKEEQNMEVKGVFDGRLFDKMIKKQDLNSSPYLSHCHSHRCLATNKKPRPIIESDDDVIITSSPILPARPRMKLLQFHSNVRPPYYGSWRKKSGVISGRAPFRTDKILDYDCDSEEEWEEEEEQGESISSASEGEESGGEESGDEADEDGFFVPHGYLSEDEGENSETETGGGGAPGSKMDKVKAKAKAWEAEFKRTCQPKKPVLIGCVWISGGARGAGGDGEERGKNETFLLQFSAMVLTETPIRVEPISATPTTPDTTITDTSKRPVPEEAMPDLIRLVHQSTAGVGKLVSTFQTHWTAVLQSNKTARGGGGGGGSGSPSPGGDSPKFKERETEFRSQISKRQLEKKIQLIAVKEQRPPSTRPTWYVHDSVFKQYQVDSSQLVPLLSAAATPISSSSSSWEKSRSPEVLLSTPLGRKATKRKAAAGNTPTLFDIIAKSPQLSLPTGNQAQKRLKLVLSPIGKRSGGEGGGGGEAETGSSKREIEPPKKRIKLETLELKSPKLLQQACGENQGVVATEIIVIEESSSNHPEESHPPPPPNTLKPLSSCTTPSRKAHTQLIHLATPPPPPPHTNPSETPTQQPPPTAPSTSSSSSGRKPIPTQNVDQPIISSDGIDATKCLLEVTNNRNNTMAVATEGEARDKDSTGKSEGENIPHIDWSKLLNSSNNSNSVTVIADIH